MKPGYITMTQRQSNNQWSGGITAHLALPQKISSAKIHWKSSCMPQFFGIKMASIILENGENSGYSRR
jgi:hypothetical protein